MWSCIYFNKNGEGICAEDNIRQWIEDNSCWERMTRMRGRRKREKEKWRIWWKGKMIIKHLPRHFLKSLKIIKMDVNRKTHWPRNTERQLWPMRNSFLLEELQKKRKMLAKCTYYQLIYSEYQTLTRSERGGRGVIIFWKRNWCCSTTLSPPTKNAAIVCQKWWRFSLFKSLQSIYLRMKIWFCICTDI